MSVDNPSVIDFVAHDPKGTVVLVMVEGREWDGSTERLGQLQEKINNYLTFATDGEMLKKYPELTGKPVRLELRCIGAPDETTEQFLTLVRRTLSEQGIVFSVKQIGSVPSG